MTIRQSWDRPDPVVDRAVELLSTDRSLSLESAVRRAELEAGGVPAGECQTYGMVHGPVMGPDLDTYTRPPAPGGPVPTVAGRAAALFLAGYGTYPACVRRARAEGCAADPPQPVTYEALDRQLAGLEAGIRRLEAETEGDAFHERVRRHVRKNPGMPVKVIEEKVRRGEMG